MYIEFSRTNNSVEGHHRAWNSLFSETAGPRVSRVIHKLIEEDSSWKDVVQDYEISPADGIRGAGNYRRASYVQNDNNIRTALQRQANNWDVNANNFLRNIAHLL